MQAHRGARRNTRNEAGLESLLHYQPTHASVEDNMKEAVHMLDLLSPDQRKGFLKLFGQFVQERQKPVVEWARLEQPPSEMLVHARDIPPCPKDQALRHELLDKMVILKLNGECRGRAILVLLLVCFACWCEQRREMMVCCMMELQTGWVCSGFLALL